MSDDPGTDLTGLSAAQWLYEGAFPLWLPLVTDLQARSLSPPNVASVHCEGLLKTQVLFAYSNNMQCMLALSETLARDVKRLSACAKVATGVSTLQLQLPSFLIKLVVTEMTQ